MDATAFRQAVMRDLRKLEAHFAPAAAVGEAAAAGTPLVIDIAWARPTVAQIAAVGNVVGVIRYFSNDSTKNLRAQEVKDYRAKGWGVGAVWETTTGRARAGYAAGQQDARTADAQRRGCGLPDDFVIKFAVDEDTTWASVQPYFQGAASVLGKDRVGVYGGYSVIEGAYAYGLRDLWQTLAWSAGKVSSHATLYQYGAYAINKSADLNHVLAADWGQYPRPEADVPLTPADGSVVAAALAKDKTFLAAVAKATADMIISQDYRDELSGAVMYWAHRAADPTVPLSTDTTAMAVRETTALRKFLQAQRAADAKAISDFVAALPADVQQAIAKSVVSVAVTVNGKTGA